jgi:hypothetical protein
LLIARQRGEKRLEELPYDAVGKRTLELRAAAAKHLHTGLQGQASHLRDQALDRRQLALALQQLTRRKGRIIPRPMSSRARGRLTY